MEKNLVIASVAKQPRMVIETQRLEVRANFLGRHGLRPRDDGFARETRDGV
jgi:hypothetical protein